MRSSTLCLLSAGSFNFPKTLTILSVFTWEYLRLRTIGSKYSWTDSACSNEHISSNAAKGERILELSGPIACEKNSSIAFRSIDKFLKNNCDK